MTPAAIEQRARAIFEHALDAILIADDGRRFVEANPAAEGLLGRPAADLVGRLQEEVTGAPAEATEAAWKRFLEDGYGSGRWTVTRPDGSQRIVDYRAVAHVLPGEHLSVLRDVTEQVELEAQLRHAQKLEAVGQLAGGIAHDFNNLLTAIFGYAELALAELPEQSGTAAAELEEVKHAALRAGDLTQKLLAFGRRQTLQTRKLDLSDVVRGAESLLRRLIGSEVELSFDLREGLPRVVADLGSLEQVLVNLCVNARDAMPGGGHLSIATRPAELEGLRAQGLGVPTGAYVALVVADDGHGMDAATLARVFEPFFTTKPVGQGTGLGLPTTHGIVTQSGGAIDVESAPGVGTTFTVLLPAAS